MNANEVIANRAIQLAGGEVGSKSPIHPNDDVNLAQSSNDAFPAVMHVALVEAIDARCCRPSTGCSRRSPRRPRAFADVVMLGRTHLMDATPVTLGQVIGGWAAQLDEAPPLRRRRPRRALPARARRHRGRHRPQRARRFGRRSRARARATDRQAVRAPRRDKFAALSAHDAVVNVERGAAHARRRRDEDRERRALVRERAARGPRRDHDPRQRARLVDHAGQGQPDAVRGADDGRGAACSATTRRSRSPARRATSSSTSTSR